MMRLQFQKMSVEFKKLDCNCRRGVCYNNKECRTPIVVYIPETKCKITGKIKATLDALRSFKKNYEQNGKLLWSRCNKEDLA